MAGITASYSRIIKHDSIEKLLEQTLRFSYPLSDAQLILARTTHQLTTH